MGINLYFGSWFQLVQSVVDWPRVLGHNMAVGTLYKCSSLTEDRKQREEKCLSSADFLLPLSLPRPQLWGRATLIRGGSSPLFTDTARSLPHQSFEVTLNLGESTVCINHHQSTLFQSDTQYITLNHNILQLFPKISCPFHSAKCT